MRCAAARNFTGTQASFRQINGNVDVVSDSQIKDIPQFKKLLDEMKGMKSLVAVMPFVGPILRLFGADVSQMKKSLVDIKNLESMVQELSAIPDKFNDLFAARGWIIYDFMNLEVAKDAIKRAEDGDIDGAEADLIDYYNAENIEWQLQRMAGVAAFRPRMELAEKALIDYREERYHACVPVVLALLDGFVNELQEKRRGFFAEEVDLQAWDSIAAHDKGLNALVKIFQKGRYKTTTDPISIPYRNGILHGMDLGYDNRMVAAKSWAALFATRDWAIRAERGLLQAQPEEPKPTWGDLARQLQNLEDDKTRLAAWKPRSVRFGENMPHTGKSSVFPDGTPEQKLAEFLNYWMTRNYGRMAQCLAVMFNKHESVNQAAGRIREIYASRTLKQFKFESSEDEAPAITNIKVRLWCGEDGSTTEDEVVARLLCEDTSGDSAVRGKPESHWAIVNYGLR